MTTTQTKSPTTFPATIYIDNENLLGTDTSFLTETAARKACAFTNRENRGGVRIGIADLKDASLVETIDADTAVYSTGYKFGTNRRVEGVIHTTLTRSRNGYFNLVSEEIVEN